MLKRRDFLKAIGLGTVALGGCALAGCSAQQGATAAKNPTERTAIAGAADVAFAQSVDVLIVGSGIAGFSAAMDPVAAGLSTLIVDKQSLLGGESYASNGVFRVSGAQIQLDAGRGTDVASSWELFPKDANWDVDRLAYQKHLFELGAEWVDRAVNDYGVTFADQALYADAAADLLLPKNGIGGMDSILAPIRDALSSKGLATNVGMRATAFIVDADSNVVGMRFRSEESNQVLDVEARCIVLATGGFSGNQELMVENLPGQAEVGCLTACAHSMGEGHDLILGIDGTLTDMNQEDNLLADIAPAAAWGAFGPVVQLDPSGQRFAPEDDRFAAANRCFNNHLGYWWEIFDGSMLTGVNATSIARVGQTYANRLLGPFDTLEQLADAMGLPQEAVLATFAAYDEAVAAGVDEAQGKVHFLQSLTAPYYALKLFPKRYRTRGGAQVDANGRLVLETVESPTLENVYCCGAVAMGTQEGLTACAASGLLAGQAIVESLTKQTEEARPK